MARVIRNTILEAPVENVWAVLREFGSWSRWHTGFSDVTIEKGTGSEAVGTVRRVRLESGDEFSEQLLTLSDTDLSLTTCLRETTIPLFNYVAHSRLGHVTDGGWTYWEWEGRFDTPSARRAELEGLVAEQIFGAGFVAMRQHLGLEA